jgi:hypothetical protein
MQMNQTKDYNAAKKVWADLRSTAALLMQTNSGQMETPMNVTVGFPGDEESAIESLDQIVETIEDAGYMVDTRYYESVDQPSVDEDYHRYTIDVVGE